MNFNENQSEKNNILFNKFQLFDLAENDSFGKLYKVKDLSNEKKM